MLSKGIAPPPEFSRPEVAKILMAYPARKAHSPGTRLWHANTDNEAGNRGSLPGGARQSVKPDRTRVIQMEAVRAGHDPVERGV